MERELVTISRIQNLVPIEGKDRIELATVENYNVIVGKGEYNIGDLCVYVFYDTILPQKPEFEFLRSRCWSKSFNGFRIKEMKMAGVFSSGIVFPLSILPPDCKIVEGKEVTDIIGAVKYDPEALEEKIRVNKKKQCYPKWVQWFFRFKIIRKIFFHEKRIKITYPDTVSKSGEVNIQKVFGALKNSGHRFTITEKLEGQSSMYCLVPKKKNSKKSVYRFYSHNAIRYNGDGSNWDIISKNFKMEEKLRQLETEDGVRYAIEGEICGPGIQGNIYGFESFNYFVFRVFNVDTGAILSHYDMWELCERIKLPYVPLLCNSVSMDTFNSVSDLVKFSDGKSLLAPVKREGVILTSMTDPLLRAKVKSEDYKIWFEKKHGQTI